jgi:hypothetical protein
LVSNIVENMKRDEEDLQGADKSNSK